MERGHIPFFLVACDVVSVGMKLDHPSMKGVSGMHRGEDFSVVVYSSLIVLHFRVSWSYV